MKSLTKVDASSRLMFIYRRLILEHARNAATISRRAVAASMTSFMLFFFAKLLTNDDQPHGLPSL